MTKNKNITVLEKEFDEAMTKAGVYDWMLLENAQEGGKVVMGKHMDVHFVGKVTERQKDIVRKIIHKYYGQTIRTIARKRIVHLGMDGTDRREVTYVFKEGQEEVGHEV